MDTEQIHEDTDFIVHIVTEIADYAVKNDMETNDTIRAIAENLNALLEIANFNNWGKQKEKEKHEES